MGALGFFILLAVAAPTLICLIRLADLIVGDGVTR